MVAAGTSELRIVPQTGGVSFFYHGMAAGLRCWCEMSCVLAPGSADLYAGQQKGAVHICRYLTTAFCLK